MSDAQTESSGGALKDIELGPSGESGAGKEKTDTGDGRNGDGHNGDRNKRDRDRTATRDTGAIGIRDSFKRTADNAGLNKRGAGAPRSEKVRRTG